MLDTNVILEIMKGTRLVIQGKKNRTVNIRDILHSEDEFYILDGIDEAGKRREGVTDEVRRNLHKYLPKYTGRKVTINQIIHEIIKELECVLKTKNIKIKQVGDPIKYNKDCGLTEDNFYRLSPVDRKLAEFTKNGNGFRLLTFEEKLNEYKGKLGYRCKKLKHTQKPWTEREQIEFKLYDQDRAEIAGSDETGVEMLEKGMYEKAIKLFDKELGICPNDVNIQSYKGTALSMLGRHDEALECHRPVGECDSYIALYNIGRTLHSMQKTDEAIKYLEKAHEKADIEGSPEEIKASILSYLASSFGMQESFDKALPLHKKAIGIDESHITLYNKGRTLYQQGNAKAYNNFNDKAKEKYRLALECFRAADRKEQKNPTILSNIGLVKSAIGKLDSGKANEYFKESEEHHNESIKLDKENAWIRFNKGISLLRMSKYYEAAKCFKNANDIKPLNSDINPAMKYAYKLADKMDEYKAQLKSVLRIQGEFMYFDKGVDKLIDLKEKDESSKIHSREALEYFNKYLNKKPGDTKTLLFKATALYDLDKIDEAIECCEEIFKKNSKHRKARIIYDLIVQYKKDLEFNEKQADMA